MTTATRTAYPTRRPEEAPRCIECGDPATAGPDHMDYEKPKCVRHTALYSIELPPIPERRGPAPLNIIKGLAWYMARSVAKKNTLWLHQALALQLLDQGKNVVISTPTASGKSLIFQMWTFHTLSQDKDSTALIFYPTKALANDQARRWQEGCYDLGIPGETVNLINGDVPVSKRDRILRDSKIVIMTPDVCHAWLIRRAESPDPQSFLAGLRTVVIDEAHTYEGTFGSNAAYMLRRLTAASTRAGRNANPTIIAATATILDPAAHMNKLTGLEFSVVDEESNGAPRHSRTLHHLPVYPNVSAPEKTVAELIISIIDADPEGQVIAFHDSRQGIERIAQAVDRPDSVLPYRSGYLPEQRRDIESRLQKNEIRAVITTSALELGIDMPDLNYGINLDLPPSRKQFHQRLGRIGRSRPGTFIVLASATKFSSYGETMTDYYENSVEPSHLYLDNEYITFQQAICLKKELEQHGEDTRVPPKDCSWPSGFEDTLMNAHGKAPDHLASLVQACTSDPPQLVHSLRSAGDENIDILLCDERNPSGNNNKLGDISVAVAMREAYPGSIYHHQGKSYRVEEWARRADSRKPFIRTTGIKNTQDQTKPVIRRVISLNPEASRVQGERIVRRRQGQLTDTKVTITESVEGYENEDNRRLSYRQLGKNDPRKTRKQREFATTAFILEIEQPWFTGEAGDPWQARCQIAEALKRLLSYRKSIPIQDLRATANNIIIETKQGRHTADNCIAVYDNINGGLGLTESLFDELPAYAGMINNAAQSSHHRGQVFPEYAAHLVRWAGPQNGAAHEELNQQDTRMWWVTIRVGVKVRVFSPAGNTMTTGTVTGARWDGHVAYDIETQEDGVLIVPEEDLGPEARLHDSQLWQPETGRRQELLAAAE